MTKKVWTTLLFLLIGSLIAYNIIKFFLPDIFIMCLTDTRILALGNFIEERAWLTEVYYYASGAISFYLFGCIATRRWFLNWWQTIVVLLLNVVSQLLYVYVPEISSFAGVATLLLITVIMGNNHKGFVIAFLTHSFCQHLIIFVRGYMSILPIMNIGSTICLSIESYIILFCYYIFSNIKEKNYE